MDLYVQIAEKRLFRLKKVGVGGNAVFVESLYASAAATIEERRGGGYSWMTTNMLRFYAYAGNAMEKNSMHLKNGLFCRSARLPFAPKIILLRKV